jgi:hypothetical protein
MAVVSLKERVAVLEAEVARLKERLAEGRSQAIVPWWEQIYGTLADSPEYEEAMRLGREYRESLRRLADESTKG